MSGNKQPAYEEVFMFSHRTPSAVSTFITLVTDSGNHVTTTPGHYVWVAMGVRKSNTWSGQPVRVEDIKVGDCLLKLDDAVAQVSLACVVGKTEQLGTGLYNPHTVSGSIVVNGIVALTFTDTLPPSLLIHSIVTAPARLLYLALKAVRGAGLANTLNEVFLSAYFGSVDCIRLGFSLCK